VERRPRPRGVGQQKHAIQHLNQRLELLEKQISSTSDEHTPSVSVSEPGSETAQSSIHSASREASLGVDDEQVSWVYRLASGARCHFQTQTTPAMTPTQLPGTDQTRERIDNSLLFLNEALEDLGNLRVRKEALNVVLDLSPAESRVYIDAYGSLMDCVAVPGVFATMVDVKFLRSLSEIMDSPHVIIKPGMRIMYYIALYYGLLQELSPGNVLTKKAYMKILESVAAWLEDSNDTKLDGHIAALISWTAINNHDYQLSWKFHCKSISYIQARGIDQLDVTPTRSFEEEAERDAHRYLYWHTFSVDVLFRLFYGKPAVIRWSPDKVRPPNLFRDVDSSAAKVTTTIVWIKATRLTAETLNLYSSTSKDNKDHLAQEVDKLCLQLEGIVAEWKLEKLMESEDISIDYRCLLVDAVSMCYLCYQYDLCCSSTSRLVVYMANVFHK